MLNERVRLISAMRMLTSGGHETLAVEIGAFTRVVGAYYQIDAYQAAGQRPSDVRAIGCGMRSTTECACLCLSYGSELLSVCREVLPRRDSPPLGFLCATWRPTTAASAC